MYFSYKKRIFVKTSKLSTMQNESYNNESVEQMRAYLRRQAEVRQMQEQQGGQSSAPRNAAHHARMPYPPSEPPRSVNVIGILGLAAAVTAFLFRDQPTMTALFWALGLVASFIGLFFRHRIWGILGFIVSMTPLVAIVCWFVINYEQLAEDGYFGEQVVVSESTVSQSGTEQQVGGAAAQAEQDVQKALQQTSANSKPTPRPKAVIPQPTKKQVDYIEIKGPKGYVNVYIGMPKDEVKALLGRADDVSVMTIGNEPHETWTYRGSSYLMIKFVNGKLDSIY